MDPKVCGVEINDKYTNIADVVIQKNKVELLAVGTKPTVPNFFTDEGEKTLEAQSDIVQNILTDLHIKKKSASIVIPDAYTYCHLLDFAKLNEKELLSAVRYQADQFIPMPIDDVSLDIQIVQENTKENKLTILVVAAPKKLVDRIEMIFEDLGIFPTSLQNEMSAFANYFSSVMQITGNGLTMVVNFGFTGSSFYIFNNTSKALMNFHSTKFGLHLFLKELLYNLDMPESKATEALKTIGMSKDDTSIKPIIAPLIAEFASELNRFVMNTKEKTNLPIDAFYIYNSSSNIKLFESSLSDTVSYPILPIPQKGYFQENPVYHAFEQQIVHYISCLAATI